MQTCPGDTLFFFSRPFEPTAYAKPLPEQFAVHPGAGHPGACDPAVDPRQFASPMQPEGELSGTSFSPTTNLSTRVVTQPSLAAKVSALDYSDTEHAVPPNTDLPVSIKQLSMFRHNALHVFHRRPEKVNLLTKMPNCPMSALRSRKGLAQGRTTESLRGRISTRSEPVEVTGNHTQANKNKSGS